MIRKSYGYCTNGCETVASLPYDRPKFGNWQLAVRPFFMRCVMPLSEIRSSSRFWTERRAGLRQHRGHGGCPMGGRTTLERFALLIVALVAAAMPLLAAAQPQPAGVV